MEVMMVNSIDEEAKLNQFKEELLSTIRNFGVDIGELIDLLKDTEFDLVQTELAENHFHYAIQAALNTIEQPEPKEICFKDAEEFTTAHTVKAFPATSREYSKLLGLENTYWGDREGYIVEDNHPLSPEEVMWISKDEFERYFKLKER